MKILTYLFRQRIHALKTSPSASQNGFIKGAFGKYLFVTNTVTAGALMGLGDYCQQMIEQYQTRPTKLPYDVRRTVNMSVVALGHGVFHHFFYGWLDKILPVITVKNVCYKILLDQFIASPACLWIFFIGMAFMENRSYSSGWQEMKNKFMFCFLVDWIVWPPSQFVNFYYVPLQYRVLYINMVTMLYDIFISYMKFYDQEHPQVVQDTKEIKEKEN